MRAKIETEVTAIAITAGDDLKSHVMQVAHSALEKQALSGVDRDGKPFPRAAKSKKDGSINLHGSNPSPLWQNVEYSIGDEAIVFTEDYAFVIEKYKADALTPENQSELESLLQPVMEELLTTTE